ncbi:hypothetical protein [Pseudoflavonifractor phocaeensis]|uniref:hypothetical protein n=1 Tax=Pseudoflavonifractor phocaeensis TaxID=1870988 RepID=UPI00195D084B|nr:hypothetical protein [Pseudoflavonifractor phocaeensis]MBM6724549.1 hypothetical protein [Pseudoflavonifractor phocaeensis]
MGNSTLTVLGSSFQPSYQTASGEIVSPGLDFKFIVVDCDISFNDSSTLKSCSIKKSDVYATSHPLFEEPIFLTEGLTPKGGNCILLFSVPIDESSSALSSYSMNVCVSVEEKSYSADFCLS